MIDIVHLVTTEKYYQTEVAEQYGVKDKLVCDLMKKVRDNKLYLRENLMKDQEKANIKQAIIESAQLLKQEDNIVFTSNDIQHKLSSAQNIDISKRYIK